MDVEGVRARSACVVVGATPEQVAAVVDRDGIVLVRNAVGTLITGRLGPLPIDCSLSLPGPVYDVLYSRSTGWFAVTIYRGEQQPVRWDNRPDEEAGYPRIDDVLGASTPMTILAVLDIPPAALDYAVA